MYSPDLKFTITLLSLRVSKFEQVTIFMIKRILSSDWLPEEARWAYIARWGFHELVQNAKKFPLWPYD